MNAPAAPQLELVPRVAAACRRCGHAWPRVFVEHGMDLHELLQLDAETFRAVTRCWVGGCSREAR